MASRKAIRDQLAGAARTAAGRGRRLEAVQRLAGGTRKGVYRLTMDDASTAIAYLWEDSENYWPAADGDGDLADPFSAGVGLDLFEAAHARLASLGLRVPTVHLVDRDRDRDRNHYPADLAIVEDFPGEHLMDRLARDPQAAEPTMARLAEAASRDQRIAGARDRLEKRLRELAAAVRPRAEYTVVHGELGLDHVMVDPDGNPVLIDIEDLMYFDVEWEHVFLRIRLHGDYERLLVSGLDEDRLALYMLAQRLSLTAGPLRLLDGEFPDRAFMQGIAEHNLNEALALVSAG